MSLPIHPVKRREFIIEDVLVLALKFPRKCSFRHLEFLMLFGLIFLDFHIAVGPPSIAGLINQSRVSRGLDNINVRMNDDKTSQTNRGSHDTRKILLITGGFFEG